jgi:nucleoside-diphosphate-sugar epimerase
VVVHCASSGRNSYRRVYRDGVANLLSGIPGARVIFTSSTSVYAQRHRNVVTETSPAEPDTTEARTLRQAEEIVLENGGIVLRVAGIYGPGRSFLLRTLLNGTAVPTDRIVNQIHRDDVAGAIFFLAQPRLIDPPRIFNVVDDMPVPQEEILEWLAARLKLPSPHLLARPPEQKRARSDKRVSNAKLRTFGWAPLYPGYREGFDRSVIPAFENCGA